MVIEANPPPRSPRPHYHPLHHTFHDGTSLPKADTVVLDFLITCSRFNSNLLSLILRIFPIFLLARILEVAMALYSLLTISYYIHFSIYPFPQVRVLCICLIT